MPGRLPLTLFAATFVACHPGSSVELTSPTRGHASTPPRLIVQLTVDQLRADVLESFADSLSPRGLGRLLRDGLWYRNAHYGHAATETAPGHATLLTGASPGAHGIVSGQWYDREAGRMVYALEQDGAEVLGSTAVTSGSTSNVTGRGPANLRVPTLGDELHLARGGRSRVFSVAGKDRSAIVGGGRLGHAFWLAGGRFVSSRHYGAALPDWVGRFNESEPTRRFEGASWTLLREPAEYRRRDADARAYEPGGAGLGSTFPHAYPSEGLAKAIGRSPASDEMVIDFSLELIVAESLGRDDVPDFLAISLSSTDYVGHYWGPASLEAEDNLYRLDAQIERLLDALDEGVGAEHYRLVLSSDHGAAELPGYWAARGHRAPVVEAAAIREAAARALPGVETPVAAYRWPYLYLDHGALARAGIELESARDAAAGAIRRLPGIEVAVTASAIERGELAVEASLASRIIDNFDRRRSGDIHVVTQPRVLPPDDYLSSLPTTHGTPWAYDTHVPIVLFGPGVPAGLVTRAVRPRDIAPTLARWLGIPPPAAASGQVLMEAFVD